MRNHLIGGSIELKAVVVQNNDKIVKIPGVSRHHGFPDLALIQLAVADDDKDAVILAVALACQRHADAAGKPLPERAGRNIDAGALFHIGMPLKDRAFLTQGMKLLLRKISEQPERRILNRAGMAFGEDVAVTVRPLGILRINIHFAVIKGRGDLRSRKRAAGMPRLCLIDHRQRGFAKLLCMFPELLHTDIFHDFTSYSV